MRPRRKSSLVLATIAAAALMLAACGGSTESGASPEPGGNTSDKVVKLKVGYIPAGIYSYLWHANDAGYFAEQKLEVELVTMAGGGAVIPALQSGTLQFGVSDALGVLNARNGGIPATYVSLNFAQAADDPVHAVLTNDPNVKEPKDLAGKTVATNLSFNTDWTIMREWLRKNGVDPKSVKFQEVPFPDMIGALRDGKLSAAGVTEPFYALGQANGYRVLGHYFTDVKSPVLFTGLVALQPYIDKNEDVVKRFVSAVNKAIEDFKKDPQLARAAIKKNTKTDPAVIDKMHLGRWDTKASLDDINFWIDAARKEGILKQSVDPKGLLWSNGG